MYLYKNLYYARPNLKIWGLQFINLKAFALPQPIVYTHLGCSMKRYGNLWEKIISFENIWEAYQNAIKGKRYRPNVSEFIFNAEDQIVKLQRNLAQKNYVPGNYKTFYIYDNKKRLISAAPFIDRVVHHALCNIIEPFFERTFIYDLYSNRVNKGTHIATKRAQLYSKQYKYVLKCDIRKYFPCIDHEILKKIIRKKIKCKNTLWLIDLIIDNSNAQEEQIIYFPEDNLFTPFERRKGMPIGNQTSQFFANIYLSPMDHFIKEKLKVHGYLRYVDDFLIFGNNKKQIWNKKIILERFLEKYRLVLKSGNGVNLYRVIDSFPFLGYRILPSSILIRNPHILKYRRKIKKLQNKWKLKQIDLKGIKQVIFGHIGHFCQSDSKNLIEKLLNEAVFSSCGVQHKKVALFS